MARGDQKSNDSVYSAREKRNEAVRQWNCDLEIHKSRLKRVDDPLKRWNYICEKVNSYAMCDELVNYCADIGLEVKRPVLDFSALKNASEKIGDDDSRMHFINSDRAKREAHNKLGGI